MSKNTKRKVFASSVTAAVVASTLAPAATLAANFDDVPSTHGYHQFISDLVETGVVNGRTATEFDLGASITRAEASKMISIILDLETNVEAAPFADVDQDAWYAEFVNALYAAGYINGYDEETFAPNQTITRAELASIIYNAYGVEASTEDTPFADVKDGAWYEEAINSLYAAGLINGQTAASFGPSENMKRGDFAKSLAETDYELGSTLNALYAPVVESVSAVDTNKIEVTFNQAVDTEAAEVSLKKGAVVYNTTVTFAEDGKSAVIEYAIDFQPGDYTVEVAGLTEETLSETVTVEEEVATSIELTSTTLTALNNETVSYKVLNQYETDMEIDGDEVVATAYNLTAKNSVTVAGHATESKLTFTNADGLDDDMTLTDDNEVNVGDQVRVTISYDGITVQGTVNVVEDEAAADISLGDVQPLEDTVRITTGESGLEIPYALVDQFNNELTLTQVAAEGGADATALDNQVTLDGVLFISSDASVVDPDTFTVDADGKLTFTAGSAGTAKITAIINETGATATTTIEVNEAAELKSLTIQQPTKIVAANDSAITLDYVAEDIYGTVLEKGDSAISVATWVSSDDTIVNDATGISFDADGNLNVTPAGAAGEVTLTAKNADDEVLGTVTFEVQEAAVPTAITQVNDVANLIAENAVLTLNADSLVIKDQYGRDYELQGTEGVLAYLKDGSETSVDLGDQAAYTATGADINNAEEINADNSEVVKLKGLGTAGSETVVLKLVTNTADATSVVAGGTYEVSLSAVDSEDITGYDIRAIDNLYGATANDTSSGYASTVDVVGLTSDGKEVTITTDVFTAITSSNTSVAQADLTNFNVWGEAEGTSTIALWIGSEKVVTETVTVVEDEPVAQSVAFANATKTVNNTTVTTTAESVDLGAELTVKDQYGVAFLTPETEGTWVSSDETVATVDANGVVTAAGNTNTGTATITFVLTNGNAAGTVEVTFN